MPGFPCLARLLRWLPRRWIAGSAAVIVAWCPFPARSSVGPSTVDVGYPTSLSWKFGAPTLYMDRVEDRHLHGFDPQRTPLAWRSGQRRIEFHPLHAELRFWPQGTKGQAGSMRFRFTRDEGADLGLRLRLPPEDYHEAPIRIIESGNWFHHVSLFGLETTEEGAGKAEAIPGHLEWRAWPDGGTLAFEPEAWDPGSKVFVEALWTDGTGQVRSLGRERVGAPMTLTYLFEDGQGLTWMPVGNPEAVVVDSPVPGSGCAYESVTRSWEVQLPTEVWPKAPDLAYPPSELDRITRIPFTIENPSDQPAVVRLRFLHPPHPNTGFVPMVLDAEGRQTGWPVQVSKNWHQRKDRGRLTNDGSWVRTSLALSLPARARHELVYAIVHARWQGVPAASGHQLSLVGWGSNGFWHQTALGSWGETLCYQPGRVLRRSMITDIRPLFQDRERLLSWTSNIGGGDVGLIHDRDGRYVPWVDARSEFLANGPNWFASRVSETLADGSATLDATFMLPRGDDYVRAFVRLEFRVAKPLEFSRFALFQFGTPYYASGRAERIVYGTADPNQAPTLLNSLPEAQDEAAVRWSGLTPWVFLDAGHGLAPGRVGFGQRGMVLRAFNGTVGGRSLDAPWLKSRPVDDRAPNLNVELGLPPEIYRFEAGDHLNALLELVILPASKDSYAGPNSAFRQRLELIGVSEDLVRDEAANYPVEVEIAGGRRIVAALPTVTATEAMERFSVRGGRGLINLSLTGLEDPASFRVVEWIDGSARPLGYTFPEEAEPQLTWSRGSERWDLHLSLRPAGEARSFQLQRHDRLGLK